jgi:hypothetical protein
MFVNPHIRPDNYIFDCIALTSECQRVVQAKTELVNYFLTEYPRLDMENRATGSFPYVHTLFESNPFVYGDNQNAILNLANQLFSGSKPLNDFEQGVLNATFSRLLKNKPTLPNRT